MVLTTGTREADGGTTKVTIADGLSYIDSYRGHHHVEQRRYEAKDLINKNVDRLLMSNGVSWADFKDLIR